MLKTILAFAFYLTSNILTAQTAETIIDGLRTVNNNVTNGDCNSGKGNIISNRAMNLFLSNKIGYYLSNDEDLSFYKNSIRFNTVDGNFSIIHNLRQAKGFDEPVKSFTNIGAKANILNGLLSRINNKHYINDLGLLIQQNWIGKTRTYFSKCSNAAGSPVSQKTSMDVERALILKLLESEIRQRDSLFKTGLQEIDTLSISGHNLGRAKGDLRSHFYKDLLEDFSRKFAELQSDALIITNHFSHITTNWTIFSIYLPMVREKFYVSRSFSSNFEDKYLYPLELSFSHSRFWESPHYGRFIIRLTGKLFSNNSYYNNELAKMTLSEYKQLGGADSFYLKGQNSNELLVGNYKNYITTQVNANIVYFPADAHFGLSSYIEQNFGSYKALNAKVGFPVVLIDKKGDPDITFEFQIRFFDINNNVQAAVKQSDKTSVGFSIAVPFSRIVY